MVLGVGAKRPGRKDLPARWVMLLCALLGIGILLVTRSPLGAPRHEAPHLRSAHASSSPTTSPQGSARGLIPPSRSSGDQTHVQATIRLRHNRVESLPSTAQTPVVASSVTPSQSLSRVPTTQPPTTTTSPNVPSSSATPPHQNLQQGWLEGPTWTSAIYTVDASAPKTISATWTSGASLAMSLSCPTGTTATSGAASLTLVASGGICTVTLSGSSSTPMTSYVLDLGAS